MESILTLKNLLLKNFGKMGGGGFFYWIYEYPQPWTSHQFYLVTFYLCIGNFVFVECYYYIIYKLKIRKNNCETRP